MTRPGKIPSQAGIEPRISALEADAIATRPTRRSQIEGKGGDRKIARISDEHSRVCALLRETVAGALRSSVEAYIDTDKFVPCNRISLRGHELLSFEGLSCVIVLCAPFTSLFIFDLIFFFLLFFLLFFFFFLNCIVSEMSRVYERASKRERERGGGGGRGRRGWKGGVRMGYMRNE